MENENNKPLWMPPGSVRAIIALTVVGTLTYLAIKGTVTTEQYIGLGTMVIGFYFITKKQNG